MINENISKFNKNNLDLGTKVFFKRNNSILKGMIYCINPVCKTYDIMDEEGVLHKDVDYEDVRTM